MLREERRMNELGVGAQARQNVLRTVRRGIARPCFQVARPSGRDSYTMLMSALGKKQDRFGWSKLDEPLVIVCVRDPTNQTNCGPKYSTAFTN
jgi:hypothetical protein